METQSKRFSLNSTDAIKLLKSLGIATGGFAAVLYLAVFNFIDADLMTALYTALGTVVVNALLRFAQGPSEVK